MRKTSDRQRREGILKSVSCLILIYMVSIRIHTLLRKFVQDNGSQEEKENNRICLSGGGGGGCVNQARL